jgi:hypothetical protein
METVKEQKIVSSTDYGSFIDQLNEYLSSGWRIVPGTLTVALSPAGEKMVGKERYLAVIER